MSRTALTWIARSTLLAAAILLGLGLVAPCMKIVPHFGQFDSWVRLLKPSMGRVSEYSVLTGILAMIEQRHVGIGILLLFFSCLFPTAKLAVMAWGIETLTRRHRAGPLLRIAHHTGKFSMLDVLVLALIVVAIKGLPGSTEVRLGWGVWAFAGSVVLSLLVSMMLHHLERDGATAAAA